MLGFSWNIQINEEVNLMLCKQIEIEEWVIDAISDEDGHLSIKISNKDGTEVSALGFDLAVNNTEWTERFSTDKIESDYEEESS